LYHPPLQSPV